MSQNNKVSSQTLKESGTEGNQTIEYKYIRVTKPTFEKFERLKKALRGYHKRHYNADATLLEALDTWDSGRALDIPSIR